MLSSNLYSTTGQVHQLIPGQIWDTIEDYRLQSPKENAKFYRIPSKSREPLFLKAELFPENFELNHPDVLKKLCEVDSPYVTKYFDIFTDRSGEGDSTYVYTLCEYANSSYFSNFLNSVPQDSIHMKVALFRLLKGFRAMHRKEILHRDISVSNMLLHYEYKNHYPRISDVNLFYPKGTGQFTSPEFLAPEALTHGTYTVQSEIWAIGIMIYYFLCGKFPFPSRADGLSISEVIEFVRNNEPEIDYSSLQAPYNEIISRCLQKDLSKRAATVDELISILRRSMGFRKYFIA